MSTSTTFIADPERTFTICEGKNSFHSLVNLLSSQEKDHRKFLRLEQTICQLDFDFYNDLLPKIAQWASDHTQAKSIELLQAGATRTVVYTAAQARYILANAFFLNVLPGYGTISLNHLYNSFDEDLSVARIRCLIEYFRLSSEEKDLDREISIERYFYQDELPDWSKKSIPIRSSKVCVNTNRMEDSINAEGFVDFANKHIHIHQIIPSATQEEVLFSCCPEAFLAILVCETLLDKEIVILRGCKRFVDYTGYADTFAYKEHYTKPGRIQDILVLDACYSGQFSKENIDRDLGKAWAGFEKSKDSIIATGNWGCGVFGGDLVFKFLQQLCAAMIIGDNLQRLDYSAYHDDSLATKLKTLLVSLEEKNKTVADVYQMMQNYRKSAQFPGSRLLFSDYVNNWLNE
ncbi:unnamed protein product [Adineta ricciae]|uniref:poly(ADP-ribose) glycohydrolase n=1 Tax=Adineta ricciae TaxID=249248 RepID=A0A814ZUC6_ADIRI|nr:unnamed protein product [Adineta ricciae]CAF1441330.1 unnamed protein product [Adineta ricciae]